MLRAAPDRIAADDYAIGESRSWLARALGLGKRRRAPTADDELRDLERALAVGAAKPRSLDEGKARKLAEIRALVDESLER
jgi:hypothetical protein